VRKKTIEKNLKKVLLEDGTFSDALYEFELEDRIAAYLQSKREDGDKYLFVIAAGFEGIAMLLIDENDKVHVNENARALLTRLWQGENYKRNTRLFMPDIVSELNKGNHYFVGVKVAERRRKRSWFSFHRLLSQSMLPSCLWWSLIWTMRQI